MIGTALMAYLHHALLQASSYQEAFAEEKMDGSNIHDADEGCEIGAAYFQARENLPQRKMVDQSEEAETIETNDTWSSLQEA